MAQNNKKEREKGKEIVKVLRILRKQNKETMLGHFSSKGYSPFQLLVATILSARARDEVTMPVSEKLFRRYPTAHELAIASRKEVEKIIKPIGFYRQKAKSIIQTAKDICDKFNDKVPETREELMQLQGVGRKVANCVLAYAFKKPAIPVDTHVHKLANHFGWVKTKTPEQTELALMKLIPKRFWKEVNEALVAHGKSINYKKKPHSGTILEKYCRSCRLAKTLKLKRRA